MSEISFQSNGYELSGNLFTPEFHEGNRAFLFIHGWTGHQNIEAAQAVSALGHVTMTYDMRGHNQCEGNLSEISRADFVQDAEAAYDYLCTRMGQRAIIGVVGSSFGAYTAAILSTSRDVRNLSLRVPANYPDKDYDLPQAAQMTPAQQEWRGRPLYHTVTKSLRAVRSFQGKIQIIEAGADQIVASQTPRNYANAVGEKSRLKYEIMPDAPHGLDNEELSSDYTSRLTRWVKDL